MFEPLLKHFSFVLHHRKKNIHSWMAIHTRTQLWKINHEEGRLFRFLGVACKTFIMTAIEGWKSRYICVNYTGRFPLIAFENRAIKGFETKLIPKVKRTGRDDHYRDSKQTSNENLGCKESHIWINLPKQDQEQASRPRKKARTPKVSPNKAEWKRWDSSCQTHQELPNNVPSILARNTPRP